MSFDIPRTSAWRYAAPAAVLTSAVCISVVALPLRPAGARTTVLAYAIAADLVVVMPGLVYALLVRGGRLSRLVIVPCVVAGYTLATLLLTTEHEDVLRTFRYLLVPAEITLLTYVALQARRVVRTSSGGDGDLVTRLRSAARTVLGSDVVAGVLATEVGILYHAFRRTPERTVTDPAFTVHREAGYAAVLAGISLVLLTETIAVHLLVRGFSPTLAWILSGLSGYGAVWLVGDFRALGSRPTTLSDSHLRIRVGLRWEVDIPLSQIAYATTDLPMREKPEDAFTAVVLGRPTLRLRLRQSVVLEGLYGMRKTTDDIWLQVDDAERLCSSLMDHRAVTR